MSKRIGNYVGFSTFLERDGGNKGVWNLIDQFYFRGKGEWALFSATGGTITTAAGKTIHTFTSSGTFEVTSGSGDVEYLVVAGGGGGGAGFYGGGGGAGGFRTNVSGHPLAGSPFPVSPGQYTVTIGAGGNGSTNTSIKADSGTDSNFYPTPVSFPSPTYVRSNGGGGGGSRNGPSYSGPVTQGANGGSGGGSALFIVGGAGNSPPYSPPQGNPGGTTAPNLFGSGGGGAGAAGGDGIGDVPYGAPGGIGAQVSITGTSTYYAGGGGGGSSSTLRPGGLGGGGAGATDTPAINAVNGTSATGGGGGGGTGTDTGSGLTGVNRGANGGSGIVIIAYPS